MEWELQCAGTASLERRTHAVVLDTPAVYDTQHPASSLIFPGETTADLETIVFFNANADIPDGEVLPLDDLMDLLESCY